MSRTTFVLGLFLMTATSVSAGNADRSPADLMSLAREALAKVVRIPKDCGVSVGPISDGHRKGRKVVFLMKTPDTVWTMSKYPEVHFLDDQDGPAVRVWDATRGDKDMPDPTAIAQWFLMTRKDPARCIKILELWFDANRNEGRIVNTAYDRYAGAYREAGREDEWLGVLKRERELATVPEAIYEIHKHMALALQEKDEPQLAINNWLLAQQAMTSRSNSYRATRYDIPYIEIAKIQKRRGDLDSAAENFEQYLNTNHGQQNPFEAVEMLGDIYEARREFGKARKLYMSVLAPGFGKGWSSQVYLRMCQEPVRKRLRLLDTQQ